MKRSEIMTPWQGAARNTTPADYDHSEFIVYKLSNIRPLKTPIINSDGSPVRGERWTSRLALERATSLNELLLETEPEWRLYEMLKNRGLPVQIKAGEIRELGEASGGNRAIFQIGDKTVTYQGAGGFVVRESGIENRFPNQEEVLDFLCGQVR